MVVAAIRIACGGYLAGRTDIITGSADHSAELRNAGFHFLAIALVGGVAGYHERVAIAEVEVDLTGAVFELIISFRDIDGD